MAGLSCLNGGGIAGLRSGASRSDEDGTVTSHTLGYNVKFRSANKHLYSNSKTPQTRASQRGVAGRPPPTRLSSTLNQQLTRSVDFFFLFFLPASV